jgi:hypothetical protein
MVVQEFMASPGLGTLKRVAWGMGIVLEEEFSTVELVTIVP